MSTIFGWLAIIFLIFGNGGMAFLFGVLWMICDKDEDEDELI